MRPGGLCSLTVDSWVTLKEISMFQLQDESSSWRGKGGGGGLCAREGVFVGHYSPHPILFLVMFPVRLTIMTTTAVFWNNNSFAECVLQENTGTCVDTKPRGISLYQCWQEMTLVLRATKTLTLARKWGYCDFVRTYYKHTQWQLNQKLIKVHSDQSSLIPRPLLPEERPVHTVCACTYEIHMYCYGCCKCKCTVTRCMYVRTRHN